PKSGRGFCFAFSAFAERAFLIFGYSETDGLPVAFPKLTNPPFRFIILCICLSITTAVFGGDFEREGAL
ncbi:MAG: hypothetical protein IIZ49_04650, partial [Oscillospiraceae bacterium]|nr:hypothetical protein [Oscillospiraceae bacterium]